MSRILNAEARGFCRSGASTRSGADEFLDCVGLVEAQFAELVDTHIGQLGLEYRLDGQRVSLSTPGGHVSGNRRVGDGLGSVESDPVGLQWVSLFEVLGRQAERTGPVEGRSTRSERSICGIHAERLTRRDNAYLAC